MRSASRTAALALAAAALALAGAPLDPAAAQGCGLTQGTGADLMLGVTTHNIRGGLSGPTLGAGASFAMPVGSGRVEFGRTFLDGPDPDVARLAGALPLPLPLLLHPGDLTVCVVAHGGAARLSAEDVGTTVIAGGLGLRLAHPLAPARVPMLVYGEVRGLGARATGSILDVDVDETGLSLGVAAGVRSALGRVTISLTGSLDGFDAGLGLTPYPRSAVEMGLGILF